MTYFKAILTAGLIALPGGVYSDAATSADSVVQIRCSQSGNTMKATGFVWPEKGMVVTALHAVAGCGQVIVSHEREGETVAVAIEAALLEADLALIRLKDDLNLPPVPIFEAQPNMRERYRIWGYPRAAKQIIDAPIDFGGGRTGVTTLRRAFVSAELNELFKNQDYPKPETQIIRITSTIQPGHSGAPIFADDGRLAAIADGGLLGGYRGINWSIPAHIYLPQLPGSGDPLPDTASEWAGLFSAATEALPDQGDLPVFEGKAGDPIPRLVRRVSIQDVVEHASDRTVDFYEHAEEIYELIGASAFEKLQFDIFEEPTTGATMAIPSDATRLWEPLSGTLIAATQVGNVELAMDILVYRGTSPADVQDYVQIVAIDYANGLENFAHPIEPLIYDPLPGGILIGSGEASEAFGPRFTEVFVEALIKDNDLLSNTLRINGLVDDYGDEQEAMALILEFGAFYLSDFASK